MDDHYALSNPISLIVDKPPSEYTREDLTRIIREKDRLLDHAHFLGERQGPEVDPFRLRVRETPLPAGLEDAAYPGLGILNVEHRVVGRTLLCEVEIELEGALAAAHEKEEPRRIPAHFIDYLGESSEFAFPLAHGDRLPAAGQGHELHELRPAVRLRAGPVLHRPRMRGRSLRGRCL